MKKTKPNIATINLLSSEMISESISVDEILNRSMSYLVSHCDVFELMIYYFNSEQKVHYDYDFCNKSLLDDKIKYLEEQSIIEWIINGKKAVLIDDPEESIKFLNSKLLITPVYSDDKILSILAVRVADKELELNKIENLLNDFAISLSVIIDYKLKKTEVDNLRNKYYEISEKLLNTTLSNYFPAIIGNLSSEIASSLKIISGNIDLIETGIGSISQRTGLIKKQLDFISKVNNKIKELNDSEKKQFNKVNLVTFLSDCLEICKNELSKNDISINFIKKKTIDKTNIKVLESELEKVILIILTNFINVLPESGQITIDIKIEKEIFATVNFLTEGIINHKKLATKNNASIESYFSIDKILYINQVLKRIKGKIELVKDLDNSIAIKLYLPIFNQKKKG